MKGSSRSSVQEKRRLRKEGQVYDRSNERCSHTISQSKHYTGTHHLWFSHFLVNNCCQINMYTFQPLLEMVLEKLGDLTDVVSVNDEMIMEKRFTSSLSFSSQQVFPRCECVLAKLEDICNRFQEESTSMLKVCH